MPVQVNNGTAPQQPKRPQPNREAQQQQLNQVSDATTTAISNLAQAGVNTINAQVFAFDSKLTQYERKTAAAMADRLRQSPLRLQAYLMEELAAQSIQTPDYEVFADEFSPPDLTSNWLAIAPTVAGCLPM